MAATDTTLSPADGVRKDELTTSEEGHMRAARQLLGFCRHGQVVALCNRIDSLLAPNPETEATAKAEAVVVQLRKADPGMSREVAMQRALRSDPALARELHDAVRGVRSAA